MTAPPPPPGTTDQILLKLGEMGEKLATISEQLKPIADHEIRIRNVEFRIPPRLEERLSSLETSRARLVGLAAAVSVIASAGGTWLGLLIAHH